VTESEAAGRVARNGYGRRRLPGEDPQTVILFFRVSRAVEKAIADRAGRNRSAWLRDAVQSALAAPNNPHGA
jgi:hypothetical protein